MFLYFILSFKNSNDTYKVIKIIDGDTITVLSELDKQYKVRLAEIDAPEKTQPYGKNAKEELSNKIFQKKIKILWKEKDQYDRVIGQLYIGSRYINQEMVEEGWAWNYEKYSSNNEIAKSQENAKTYKKGLWQSPNPIPPWKWRKKRF
jgi:endonuclease YncB( thermonuclease family)